MLSVEEIEEALEDPERAPYAVAYARSLIYEYVLLDEVDICREHPAFLIDRMVGQDERTGEAFHFDVLTAEERARANYSVIDSYGEDESGWPSAVGWRAKDGKWFWQRELLDEWEASQRHIDLKARQLGATWLACGKTLHTALYLPGSLSLMYRQKQEEAFENVGRVWTLLHSLPEHLWNGGVATKPSKGAPASEEIRLEFTDKRSRRKQVSRVLGMTSASASGHGKTAALVVLDEFSRIDRAAEIMKAVQPAAGRRGKILVISTANGVSNPETGEGNQFHWLWTSAEEAGFQRRFLPWSLHPDRDQDWYDRSPETRGLKSWERAEQYPANQDEAFALTTNNFFDPEDIAFYGPLVPELLDRIEFRKESPSNATVRKRSDGIIRLYEAPQEDVKYAIGADPSTGLKLDYSAACVVNLATMAICAELYARIDLDLFAYQLHYLGKWFNTAKLAVETSGGYGHAVITPLRDGREGRPPYPSLYRHKQWSRPTLDEHKGYGWPTNSNTRPGLVNQLERHVREKALPYMPRVLMDEAKTFLRAPLPGQSQAGTWPRAQNGTHDDMIFATAIALQMYHDYGEWPDRKRRKPREPLPSRPWHGITKPQRGRGSRDAVAWNT
jgi:hypothetical protein